MTRNCSYSWYGGWGGIVCFLLTLLIGYLVGEEDQESQIRKRGGSINYNGSRRIPHYSWARVDYTIINEQKRNIETKIRMSPLNQRNITIYDIIFSVPGLRKMLFGNLVTIGSVNNYAVDLFVDGQQMTNANERLNNIRLGHPLDHYLLFLNDDPDIGYGNFAQNEGLGRRYVNVICSANKVPVHWSGYDYVCAVFLYRPNFQQYSIRQFNALIEFVLRGGTLIFMDPQGIESTMHTPLRELIPVTPIQICLQEFIEGLQTIGGRVIESKKNPIPFLFFLPHPGGFASLKEGNQPLVYWKRYGLGIVGVTACSPSVPVLRTADYQNEFNLYWRHLLQFANRNQFITSSRDAHLAGAVDKLTGIKIPTSSEIKRLVIGYLGVVFVIILVLGVLLRRHLLGWLILSIFASGFIVFIFFLASQLRQQIPNQTASMIEFSLGNERGGTREQMVCLFLKQEKVIDLPNTSPGLYLRSMPPAQTVEDLENVWIAGRLTELERDSNRGEFPIQGKKKSSTSQGTKGSMFGEEDTGEQETVTEPLRITIENGYYSFRNMMVKAAKPQFFNTLSSLSPGEHPCSPFEIGWVGDRVVMEKWKIPEGLKKQIHEGWIIFPEGFFALKIENDEIVGINFTSSESQSPIIQEIMFFLLHIKLPTPVVALVGDLRNDQNGFIHSNYYTILGRKVWLLPVYESLSPGKVVLPPYRVRLESYFKDRRYPRVHGYWVANDTMGSESPFQMIAVLPPGYFGLIPEKIRAKMEFISIGPNVQFKLHLLAPQQIGRSYPFQYSLETKEYILDCHGIPPEQIRHPADGIILLEFIPVAAQKVLDPVVRKRLNQWRIQNIQVSLEGTIPPTWKGSL